jgi:hypothetical protein
MPGMVKAAIKLNGDKIPAPELDLSKHLLETSFSRQINRQNFPLVSQPPRPAVAIGPLSSTILTLVVSAALYRAWIHPVKTGPIHVVFLSAG